MEFINHDKILFQFQNLSSFLWSNVIMAAEKIAPNSAGKYIQQIEHRAAIQNILENWLFSSDIDLKY